MSSDRSTRAALVKKISQELGRELSARTVMFHTAIAERLGLNATDHKALDLLSRAGPLTAGELADLTGLTTGAITGVVDRLEKAGYVRRVRDLQDRRKVVIAPVDDPERFGEVLAVFDSLSRSVAELCARYSDAELAAIDDFVSRSLVSLQDETAKLRGAARPAPALRTRADPGAEAPREKEQRPERKDVRGET